MIYILSKLMNTNYPIILVHGLGAKDNNFFWGRIPKTLQSKGVDVYLGSSQSWGCIEYNAEQLAKRIDEILHQTKKEKVNLIAHSKGGVDARYLISTLGYDNRVASLTTVSTPHRGAEIADFIHKKPFIYKAPIQKAIETMVKVFGDKSSQPYKILEELQTCAMQEFNKKNPNKKNVYYSSYHSILKNATDDLTYYASFQYISKIAGPNDGVVSMKSAEWGESFTLIQGKEKIGISHTDIVDLSRRKISGIEIPDIYVGMVDKLIEKGL